MKRWMSAKRRRLIRLGEPSSSNIEWNSGALLNILKERYGLRNCRACYELGNCEAFLALWREPDAAQRGMM